MNKLLKLVKESINEYFESELKSEKIETIFISPDFSSSNTVKNGKSPKGVQKYKCKDCGNTRVITRNSLNFSSKKLLSNG